MLSLLSLTAIRGNSIGYLSRLCKISKNHSVKQIAFISRLINKEPRAKPEPYPYWTKECDDISMFFDPTSLRYDENTKLIVVDGPPAVGKTELCKKLAEEFGLLYMPPPTHDEIYISPYGYDVRQLDPKLPPSCRSCDLKKFLNNPHDPQVPAFQLMFLVMRIEQYMNAVLHMLATGQGVVLNRCVFTESAFVDAMHNAGYLNTPTVGELDEMRSNVIKYLLKPHVIIYLEASPETTLANIKKRGNVDEINSKVFTKQYLLDMENVTKRKNLSILSPHSHIMVYDWNKKGNLTDVISDIEEADLEEKDYKEKFQDWVFLNTDHIVDIMYMCQDKEFIYTFIEDVPANKIARELYMTAHEYEKRDAVMDKVQDDMYEPGYNPEHDEIPLIGGKQLRINTFRRTPRDFVNCNLFKIPG